MVNIIEYVHHFVPVSVIEDDKGKHREHCLCWQGCKWFFPSDREKNCKIANALFEFDKLCEVTTPVWECADYIKFGGKMGKPSY